MESGYNIMTYVGKTISVHWQSIPANSRGSNTFSSATSRYKDSIYRLSCKCSGEQACIMLNKFKMTAVYVHKRHLALTSYRGHSSFQLYHNFTRKISSWYFFLVLPEAWPPGVTSPCLPPGADYCPRTMTPVAAGAAADGF